jgi:2-methylfumaryl-CoA hydratase
MVALVFAWLEGLASRDVSENSVWELGFTEGYHTQPSVSGDTVAALSRVLAVEEAPGGLGCEVRHRHFPAHRRQERQLLPRPLPKYGADLFIKENDKKEMGKEKIDAEDF